MRYRSFETQRARMWDRICFGSEDIQPCQPCRNKPMFHTFTLTLFLTLLAPVPSAESKRSLKILQQTFRLNIQAGKHESSIINLCDGHDSSEQDSVWRLLMTELSEDFSRREIEVHKVEIKDYIPSLRGRVSFCSACLHLGQANRIYLGWLKMILGHALQTWKHGLFLAKTFCRQ